MIGEELKTDVLYWVEREFAPGRWKREDGWADRDEADRSARFYRRQFHRRARVVAYRRRILK